MADLPLQLADVDLADRLDRALDPEGKIARAFEALGPVAGRDVVLLDAGEGRLARRLAGTGARLTVLERPEHIERLTATVADLQDVRAAAGTPEATGLPARTADVVIAAWSAFRGPDPRECAEAERILRSGGRLLVLHDYGRDDVSRFHPADRPEYTHWSHRGGPFFASGFRIRVLHCRWTFETADGAAELLRAAFGPAAPVETIRERLSYNVAIYHRSIGEVSAPR